MKNKWIVMPEATKEFLEKFPEYPNFILKLLYVRQITKREDIERFLNPRYEDLYDPYELPDLKKAVDYILQSIKKKEKICIFSDYDVDGVTSMVIMRDVLKILGSESLLYVPDRNKEGYGLSKEIVQYLKEKEVNLLITTDCGIANVDEIKELKKLGIKTIVIDHHLAPSPVPPSIANVNPCTPGSKYPFKELSAGGVAFKVAVALLKKTEAKKDGYEKWFLDLVSLSTVADMEPLLDENRIFVKYGLIVMAKTKRKGLKSLMEQTGIDPNNLRAYHLGYILAPHINAASRVDHANQSLKLIMATDNESALELSKTLMRLNKMRQKMIETALEKLKKKIDEKKLPPLIFEGEDDINPGVIGLIAGKLVELYNRPCVIYSFDGNNAKASARSIDGFNVVDAFSHCKDKISHFGGHPMAGGFGFDMKNQKGLKTCLLEYADKKMKKIDLTKKIFIDARIRLEDVNLENFNLISAMEPFGYANREPSFLIENVGVYEVRAVGKENKHLKLRLKSNNFFVSAILFNHAHVSSDLKTGDMIDLVGTMILDEWGNTKKVEIRIIDLIIK